MARSYKRDKNGKFASGGGGSASGTRLSGRVTYRSPESATGSSGTYRNAGTGRKRGLTMAEKNPISGATRSPRDLKEGRAMNRKSEKTYNKTVAGASSGGSSRGKSLRQSVRAKRSVAATTKANGGLEQTTAKTIRGGDSGKKVLKGATYRANGGWTAAGKVSAAAAASLGPYHKPTAAATKKSNQLLAESHRKSIAASSAKSGSHRLFGKKK